MALVASALVVAGCGGSNGDADSAVDVTDAFLGEAAAGKAAALYLTLEQNGGDDRLVGVATDVSDVVGIMPATIDMDDALTDRSVDIEIAAGSTLSLAPGEDHLMVIAIDRDLRPGDDVVVTLTFERHDPVTVTATTLSLLDINERVADSRDDEEGAGVLGGSDR